MGSRKAKRTSPSDPLRGHGARGRRARPGPDTPADPPGSPALTPREREIAQLLIGTGLSYKQIAAQLGRSEGTVRTHTEHIYRACGVHSRVELIVAFRALAGGRSDAA